MNKQELIKKYYDLKKDLEKEMRDVSRDFERYYSVLGAMSEFLDLAEQLDDPKTEECKILGGFTSEAVPYAYCTHCDCNFVEEDSLPENDSKVNYCPNCGRKIKKGEKDGR